jgi:DnaK suppressor protein
MEIREHLLRQRKNLVSDAAEERPTYSTHMADAGTDAYDRDWALGMLSSEQDALYEVDQALARIRTGKYGFCELTGNPIEPERLLAIPWTRFNASAERQVERNGDFKRSRLGPRESIPKGEPPEEKSEPTRR